MMKSHVNYIVLYIIFYRSHSKSWIFGVYIYLYIIYIHIYIYIYMYIYIHVYAYVKLIKTIDAIDIQRTMLKNRSVDKCSCELMVLFL